MCTRAFTFRRNEIELMGILVGKNSGPNSSRVRHGSWRKKINRGSSFHIHNSGISRKIVYRVLRFSQIEKKKNKFG